MGSREVSVHGSVQGGLCPWGLCPERSLLGGLCPGGSLSGSLCLGERGLCQRDPPPYSYVQAAFLLPSTMKLRRLCFYTCVSVHRGGLPQCMLGYHPLPGAGTTLPWSRHPPVAGTAQSRHPPEQAHLPPEQAPPLEQAPPTTPSRRLLFRTVRILLECILVIQFYYNNKNDHVKQFSRC